MSAFRSFSLEQLLSAAALGLLTGYLVARSTISGKKAGDKTKQRKPAQDKRQKAAVASPSSKDTQPKTSKGIEEDSEDYVDSEEDDFTDEDESLEDEPNEGLKEFDLTEEFKMVLVIRTDLGMGKGKAAAQCCHATLANYKELAQRSPNTLKRWEYCGQAKVTLKVDSEEEMLKLQQKAREVGLAAHSIRDAGRTQIAAGSRTVLAVGPGPVSIVNQVTGHLKLY